MSTIASKLPFQHIPFRCREKIGHKTEEWDGYVRSIHNHGSHYEIRIESRSGFTLIVGSYEAGAFLSIPAFQIGSDLADYSDYFWNNDRLATIMSPVDAATVAEALRTLSEYQMIQ